jgi:hypothetical protein
VCACVASELISINLASVLTSYRPTISNGNITDTLNNVEGILAPLNLEFRNNMETDLHKYATSVDNLFSTECQ